jgi:tRNA pseudouridine38-40 synthase
MPDSPLSTNSEKQKYFAKVSYLGTEYCGWQRQKVQMGTELPSVQLSFESILQKITSEDVRCVGSGRTDSGVHALGQGVHFVLQRKLWDPKILLKGMNSLLPRSIRVLELQTVPLDFHAQRSALKKQYSYYFQQGPCALPHLEPYSWWIQKSLNTEAMQQALSSLVGEHDFKPFQASGAKPGPTTRQILEAQVSWEKIGFPHGQPNELLEPAFGLVRIRLVGTGFLKQMVRGIAGTLLQVGEGRRPPTCIQEILELMDRSQVGPTAPGRALWLEKVWYPSL